LKDLAEQLGISISTVSRALKDHPDVNQATKTAVLNLARDLDYEPNLLALNLLNKHSNYIAVIVPRISYHLYAEAISGIEEIAEAKGYNLFICQSNESFEREAAFIKEFNAIRVAGFIISVSSNTNEFGHFKQLQKKNIPLVFFNRAFGDVAASQVIIDNHKAAYHAVDHLYNEGYRNIAYIGGPLNVQISQSREEGYIQALSDHNLNVNGHYIKHIDFSQKEAENATKQLLELSAPPDAILAFSDQLAIGAMLAIKKSGRKIPDDIAVIGFNNEPVDELIEPALTSIDQPAYDMGRKAAQMLFNQIENEISVVETKVLEATLIVRDTSQKSSK
jgi:LacI family transcriptional regulator